MTSSSETRVDPFRPGAEDGEALALRAEVWGDDHPHSHPAFFRWLFGPENPAGPGSGVMLRRAGQLVGFAGLCPRLAYIGGRVVRVAHGLDYMVSPGLSAAASGRFALRVASEWATLAGQGGYSFGINFPNANSRRLLTSDKLGWQPVLTPDLYIRPLAAPSSAFLQGSGLRRFALRFGLGLGARALGLCAALSRGEANGMARGIDIHDARDAAMVDALWQSSIASGAAGLVRDAAALRWRYGHHPIHQYQIFGWQHGEALQAVIVTAKRNLFGMDCLLMADALLDPAAPIASATRLVNTCIRDSGAALLVAQAVKGQAFEQVLRRAGCIAPPVRFNPKPFLMVALPMAEAAGSKAFPDSNWRFGWGDMDVV